MDCCRRARLLALLGVLACTHWISSAAAEQELIEKGRALAEEHCIRCHVVKDDSPFSGIASTPSFRLLVTALPDWQERFETFYQRRPHPAVVRFRGFAPLTDDPPTTQTVDLVLEDVEAIVAFAVSLRQRYEEAGDVRDAVEGPDPLLGGGPGPDPGAVPGPAPSPGSPPGQAPGSGQGPATRPAW